MIKIWRIARKRAVKFISTQNQALELVTIVIIINRTYNDWLM